MQLGEDHLHPGQSGLGLGVDRDPAPVVAHLDGPVRMQYHNNMAAEPGERLIDPVVDDLPDAAHQTAAVGRPDVHPRSLAHRLESLENEQVTGVVRRVDAGDTGGHETPRVTW